MAINTDLVRILVGDNDPDNQLITDDDLTAIVAAYSSDRMAAAAVADAIAGKFSRKVTFSLEGLRFENSQKAAAYLALATRLRFEAESLDSATGEVEIGASVTGVSIAAMDAVDDDDDRPPSMFKVGMQK